MSSGRTRALCFIRQQRIAVYNSEYKNVTLNKIGIFRSKNLLTLLGLSSVSTD